MPEENEYLEATNNKNNDVKNKESSRNSSSKSSHRGSASNITDFNKYKSRKKNSANFNNDSPKGEVPHRQNRIVNNLKNQVANRALSSVPALRTLNNLNNIRKSVMARRNATPATGGIVGNNREESSRDDGITNSVTGNDNTNDDSVVSSEESEASSLNPLSSIFGGRKKASGRFCFFGKLSTPVKLLIGIFGPLVGFMLVFFIPIVVVGLFSGLFATDEVFANNNIGTSGGNIDYGDYVLSSDGDQILHERLDTFLQSNGTSLEEFNNLIASNVQEAGYGTRAGVVAAAVTLIAELGNNYNVKVPYFGGGGHGSISVGAEASWGSNTCYTSANGQIYSYCGLDCSGFVTWAINNGGFSIPVQSSGTFVYLDGAERVSLSNSAVLQAGDLLATSGHIILIVGVDDSGYICAEAAGNETGVLFSRKSFDASSYYGIDMSGFYGG